MLFQKESEQGESEEVWVNDSKLKIIKMRRKQGSGRCLCRGMSFKEEQKAELLTLYRALGGNTKGEKEANPTFRNLQEDILWRVTS